MKKNYYLLVLMFLFGIMSVYAQVPCASTTVNGSGTTLELFWVGNAEDGGNGDWNEPCSWRVGSVTGTEIPAQAPRPKDNVHFVDASFSMASKTVSVNGTSFCGSFNMDSTFANPFTFTCASALNIGDVNNGGFNIASAANVTANITGNLNFVWAGAHDIDLSDQTLAARLWFNNATGVFNLQTDVNLIGNNWVFNSQAPFRLISGTLNTNNFTINVASVNVALGGVLNGGTSTFNLYGALRIPNTASIKGIKSSGGLRLANATVNLNRTNSVNIETGSADELGDINLNNTGFNSEFRGVLNSAGNVNVGNNVMLTTRNVNIMGNLFLGIASKLRLFSNLTVGGIVQDPGVDCAGINIINTTGPVRTLTATNDINLHDVSISNIAAQNSASGGCSSGAINYVIVDGINLGGSSCWDITTIAPRTLNWTGAGTDDLWTNPNNWDLGCVPNAQDDVFFANMNAKTVDLNINGAVNNMTWVADGSVGTFVSSNNSSLEINGNITLNPTMNWDLTSQLRFLGNVANTMDFSTQVLDNPINIIYGNYTLLSNLDNATRRMSMNGACTFTANNRIIDLNDVYFITANKTLNLDNTVINLHGDEGWYDYHGTVILNNTGTTVLNFLSILPRISGRGEQANKTFNIPGFTTLAGSTLSVFRNETATLNVKGDVTIGGNVYFNGSGLTSLAMKDIVINGNLNIQAGHRTLFAGGTGKKVTITGSLNMSGVADCTTTTEIKTVDGSGQVETDIQGGTSGLDFVTLQNMNANGYASPIASNVIDLGGNNNWTFTGTTATAANAKVYYWRADASAPTMFNGDWNDPNHWTITQANVVGDGGCAVPTSLDSVVFDNLSDNGGITGVTVPANFYCHDFTVSNSHMRFEGADNSSFFINGSMDTDATFISEGGAPIIQNLNYRFTSTDPAGETITAVNRLRRYAHFSAGGSWTLMSDFRLQTDLVINGGTLISNGNDILLGGFIVNADGATVNLSGSTVSCHTWNLTNANGLTFTAPDNINVALNMFPQDYNYKTVTATGGGLFQILEPAGATFEQVDIDVNSNINGNNTFGILNYIPTNGATRTHTLQSGTTQTIMSPNGQVNATGLSNGFLNIKSSDTAKATIHKDQGDQMCWDFVILDNLDATEDTDTNTPSPAIFGGLNNTTSNLGGTLFDFTRGTFIAPTVNSGPDQSFCRRTIGSIEYEFQNSGPYTVTYTDGTNTFVESGISHGTASIHITVFESTTYTVLSVEGDNCGSLVAGAIIDATQTIEIPPLNGMALDGDTSSCFLNDEGSWIHFVSGDGNSRSMTSVFDIQDGTTLGDLTTDVAIETVLYMDGALSIPYMRRHVNIETAVDGDANVRLYFTQAELDQLSTDVTGSPGNINISDLKVRKYNNNTLDFTGGNQELAITNTGDEASVPLAEALDFTNESNVFFLDVNTNTFGHFVIFADSATLSNTEFSEVEYNVQLYPNPAKNHVNILVPEQLKLKEVQVFNMLGQKVLEFNKGLGGTPKFSTQTLSEGTYMVRIKIENSVITKKLSIHK